MTEEEYFRKNYPDSCYGDKPLSPYWDFFQCGVEFGERQSETKIEELEKENAGQKERLELLNLNANIAVRDLNDLLTKAKEIISAFVEWANWEGSNCPSFKSIQDKTEQFLKDIEK